MDARLRRLLSAPALSDVGAVRVHQGARRGMLVLAGLGCGASPAFFGYFDMSLWGPVALALIAVAIGLLLAKPVIPTGIAAVAVLGLLLFAAWCLLSVGWAEYAERAITEGDRWILYGVFLLVLILLIADKRDGEIFLVSTVLAVLCIAGYDLTKTLVGEGSSLFGGSRLLQPLGYVNGLGGYFLLGFWPLMAVAERARGHVLSGLAAGLATLLGSLVLLTDSRGTVVAFGVSAIVLLALLPRRNRRAWALLVVLVGLGVAWNPLADVTRALPPGHSVPLAETIRRGAEWSVLAAVCVAVGWGTGSWIVDSLRDRSLLIARRLPQVSAVLLSGVAVAVIVTALVAVRDPARSVSEQYDAFTQLKSVSPSARFTSGGGDRYDYWRIAWAQFLDHPLDGVGAGNFDRTYFLERRTNEDVRQAHSIELQTLGETGIIGALTLGAFFVAVFVGFWRRARAARSRGSETGLTVAAAGMFIVWFTQTSGDWLHLIPGLTGIALGAGAVLLLRPGHTGEGGVRFRALPPLGMVSAFALAVVAIVFIGRPTLSEHLRTEAQNELGSHPRAAILAVNESISLEAYAVQGYYIRAAALARLDAYRPAKNALAEAISREPHNYVSWALLGDLATRRGAVSEALRAYGRASSLNPRDHGLRSLGSQPGLIARLHSDPGAVISLPGSGE